LLQWRAQKIVLLQYKKHIKKQSFVRPQTTQSNSPIIDGRQLVVEEAKGGERHRRFDYYDKKPRRYFPINYTKLSSCQDYPQIIMNQIENDLTATKKEVNTEMEKIDVIEATE
jgi:hypothetical protein